MPDANRAALTSVHDVAVCGGGLAGQTVARQLRRRLADASIVVLDPLSRPLPAAAFKVGESTVEVGAFYFAEVLGLADLLEATQLHKLGLRYFFGDAHGPLHERPEFGLSEFPAVPSYQLDRGVLENDLRRLNQDAGIVLLEGYQVVDVDLAEAGADSPHELRCRVRHAARSEPTETLRARWVIDATGRRRLLQRKLGLVEAGDSRCSAAWFRIERRVDVDELVEPAERAWHQRVPGANRYYSTNHLMGDGYWVWLIPLSSGCTSIGIVADESLHPFAGYNTHARACRWLEKHEPVFAASLCDQEPLDFLALRKYSHRTEQVISTQRWACVGDAGFFSDPFYSPGSDLIGFSNSIVTEVITRDAAGAPPGLEVKTYNRWLVGLNDLLTTNIQRGYPFFGRAMPMAAKLLWDFAAQWGYAAPQMFNGTFLTREAGAPVRDATSKFFFLQNRMQQLFEDWAARSLGACSFEYFDYLALPFLSAFRLRNLEAGKRVPELVDDARANMQLFEELAQVLFLVAIADVLPEQAHRFSGPVWLNAWSVSLDPSRWDAEDLQRPRSPRRDLDGIGSAVFAAFGLHWGEAGPG